jgi:transposase
MARLSQTQRSEAIGMLRAGSTQIAVAQHFNCSRITIRKLTQRYQTTGMVNDRPRSGRPKVLTPRQERYIRITHLRDRFKAAAKTARETIGTHGRSVHHKTISRQLKACGIRARRPYVGTILTRIHRRNRLRWCLRHARWTRRQWGSVLFTDESKFNVSHADGRKRVWRRRGVRFAPCCIREVNRWVGGSVHIWGGITAFNKTDLVVLAGNINAQQYQNQVLAPVAVPFMRRHLRHGQLQQDNARPHTARINVQYLQQHNITVMDWPANSPVLNPIENI